MGGLLPFAAVLILLVLPTNRWDSRPLYLAIFVAVLLVCYIEILLFDLEDRLRRLGKRFAIAFPAVVFVVAFFITTSPHIVTHPASWDPMVPRAYEAERYLQRKKDEAEFEQWKRKVEADIEMGIYPQKPTRDRMPDALQGAFDRARQGKQFEFYPLQAETDAERAVRLDAERGIPVESMAERITPAYKEALLEWEKTRRFIPPEHSLELKDSIDRRVAPYWLALLLLVGAIEFRLLSQSSSRSAVSSVNAAKKPPTG